VLFQTDPKLYIPYGTKSHTPRTALDVPTSSPVSSRIPIVSSTASDRIDETSSCTRPLDETAEGASTAYSRMNSVS